MYSKMMQLVNRMDSLPLTPPQQKEIVDYAKSLTQRFEVARKVEQTEKLLLDSATKYLQDHVAELSDLKDAGWVSHDQDLQFILRTVTQAMLLDDDEFARKTAVDSLSREFTFLELPITAVNEVIAGLRQACDEHLPPSAADTLSRYFESATIAA
jgi:hypothetical protein